MVSATISPDALATGRTPELGQTPALYEVTIGHVRTAPVRHGFTYRGYQWLVDLDELPRLPRPLRPLARFEASDHLGDPARSIRANLETFLAARGVDIAGGRILMLANARVLGYVFNPLSVFWCYDRSGRLACVVAEVHNTYGERHAYLLHTDQAGQARTRKQFYVSPFNPVDGEYAMSLPEPGADLALTITLHRSGSTPFVATVRGARRPASAFEVLRAALRHPAAPLVAAARIRRQGLTLWLRGLRPSPRPHHHQEDVS